MRSSHTQMYSMDPERLFLQIYRSCFEAGFPVVTSRGGSTDDYRDCFQRALVSFYERLVNVEPDQREPPPLDDCTFHLRRGDGGTRVVEGRPCAYLYGIVWRLFFKDIRDKPPVELRESITDADLDTPAQAEEASDQAERAKAYIQRHFNAVEQDLIYLRYTEGLSYDEASEVLQGRYPDRTYSPGYLRVMMNRMMAELRTQLNQN